MALVEIDVDLDLAHVCGLEGGLDVGLQGRLVAFGGEETIGSYGADGLGVRHAFGTSLVLDPGKMLQQKPQSGGSCGFIRQGGHGAGSESEAPINSPLPQFVNAVNPSSEP